MTEFKYYRGSEVKKLYLSAILDLYDRRIVSYKIGDSNNNELVFSTFDGAVALNPDAHPLFHSDRGFQYTTKTFHQKLLRQHRTINALWALSALACKFFVIFAENSLKYAGITASFSAI